MRTSELSYLDGDDEEEEEEEPEDAEEEEPEGEDDELSSLLNLLLRMFLSVLSFLAFCILLLLFSADNGGGRGGVLEEDEEDKLLRRLFARLLAFFCLAFFDLEGEESLSFSNGGVLITCVDLLDLGAGGGVLFQVRGELLTVRLLFLERSGSLFL